MNKSLKVLVFGYFFGFGIVWLLYLVLIPVIGTGDYSRDFERIFSHSDTILQQSLFFGLFGAIVYWILFVCSQRHRAKIELENEMTEYFRKQNKKDEK